ncbi:hypothetical protein ACH5RR_040864 [Cinchona calisaya]|uniref:RNase H type-1 domain-containing protein n=1 Tax=Cinchona calisaya TaxID=153742 RepID=A0ABD2XSI5_9GENT
MIQRDRAFPILSTLSCRVLLKPRYSPFAVVWIKLVGGSFKINMDGLAMGNLGHFTGGGVIRDSFGRFLHGFYSYFGMGNNDFAETKALFKGLQLCPHICMHSVLIDTDSQHLSFMLLQNSSLSRPLGHIVCKIKTLLMQGNLTISHIFRKANSFADCQVLPILLPSTLKILTPGNCVVFFLRMLLDAL